MDVEGTVTAAPEKITGCTQQDVEVQLSKVREEGGGGGGGEGEEGEE